MSKSASEVGCILANWQVKRDKVRVAQSQAEAENQRRAEWQQAQYALLDCDHNLATHLGRRHSWKEMTKEYAARLCAWVGLWPSHEVSALQNLPLLSPEEEQLHPGTSAAAHLALRLVTVAHLGNKKEVRDLFDQLRDDHLADSRAREDMRELRRLVLLWLHHRLQDVVAENRKAEQTLEVPGHATPPRSSGGTAMGPTVDDEDEKILRALADNAPRLLTQDDLEAQCRVSRRTISKRMKNLLQDDLVAQPKGPKRGTTIAGEGLKLLKRIDAAKPAQ
jgi:hypothetical protein